VVDPDIIAPIDVVVLPAVLILAQTGFGTTLVIVLVALTMMLLTSASAVSLNPIDSDERGRERRRWGGPQTVSKDRVLLSSPGEDLGAPAIQTIDDRIGSGGLSGLAVVAASRFCRRADRFHLLSMGGRAASSGCAVVW